MRIGWVVAIAAMMAASVAGAQTSPSPPQAENPAAAPQGTDGGAPALLDPEPFAPAGAAMADPAMRELLNAARETAKATRESADAGRAVPDILHRILVRLDGLEAKLDRIENALRQPEGGPKPRARGR